MIIIFFSSCIFQACTLHRTAINSDEIKNFEKEIKKAYKEIKSFNIDIAGGQLNVRCEITKDIDKDKSKEIFLKIREFIITDEKLGSKIKENNKPTSMKISISINTPSTWYRYTTVYKDDENGKNVADYMRWGFDGGSRKNDDIINGEIIDLEKESSKN